MEDLEDFLVDNLLSPTPNRKLAGRLIRQCMENYCNAGKIAIHYSAHSDHKHNDYTTLGDRYYAYD